MMSSSLFLILCAFLLLTLSAVSDEMPNPITVDVVKKEGSNRLTLSNRCDVPVSYRFTFKLSNCRLSEAGDRIYVVPGNRSVAGPVISQSDSRKAWRWDYTSKYRIGDYRVTSTEYVYPLPWSDGHGYKINQGFHGDISHQGLQAYALDFDLPEGTPVAASRQGLVVSLHSDSNQGGGDPSFRELANYVILAHPDGTVSRYFHLQQGTVEVALGEWVEAGRVLGRSGNTGFSTAPHLHFDVCAPDSHLEFQTMPVRLWVNGQAVQPGQGATYSR